MLRRQNEKASTDLQKMKVAAARAQQRGYQIPSEEYSQQPPPSNEVNTVEDINAHVLKLLSNQISKTKSSLQNSTVLSESRRALQKLRQWDGLHEIEPQRSMGMDINIL